MLEPADLDAQGRVIVTTDPVGADWRGGFLRNAKGIVVALEAAGERLRGHLRDANGALCVTEGATSTWWQGFPVDVAGRICITQAAPDGPWHNGTPRMIDDHLAVAVTP